MADNWITNSSSKMHVSISEYINDYGSGTFIMLHRYKSHITNEFVNEWAVWNAASMTIAEKGVVYGSLADAKKVAETASEKCQED